jgi:diaminopimelate decarboxylase
MEALEKINNFLSGNIKNLETPCYLYDVGQFISNYNSLKNELGTELVVSLKANSCFEYLIRYQHMITDFEIASINELNAAVQTKKNIYLNTPAADEDLLRAALASKAVIIVDNLRQLDIILKYIDKAVNKKIIFRLNQSVINQFSDEKLKITPDYFGMDWQNILNAIDKIKTTCCELYGLHVFNGPFSFKDNALITAGSMSRVIKEVEKKYENPLGFVNLGGGFNADWQNDDLDFSAYRMKLKEIPTHIKIAHESGRGIFGNTGYYLTKVINKKETNDTCIAVCDGGLSQNFLLAQTESKFRKFKIPEKLKKDPKENNNGVPMKKVLIGSTCSRNDTISILPENYEAPEVGDIYMFRNCGAYNYSYSVTKFLSLKEAKQYIIT